MNIIILENGIKILVINNNIAHILIAHFNRLSISANIVDTTKNDLDKANYTNYPSLISNFNNLQRQDIFLR